MNPFQNLMRMIDMGFIGLLLVSKFKGEIGRTPGRKDANFMIEFESVEKTPQAMEIRRCLLTYFKEMRYFTKLPPTDNHENVCLVVRAEESSCDYVTLVVTPFYPHDGKYNFLRTEVNVMYHPD